jgi:hypothetical protein
VFIILTRKNIYVPKIINPTVNITISIIYFLVLKKLANPNIEGTQIPTNIPSSFKPLNHNDTENKKLKKAKMIG